MAQTTDIIAIVRSYVQHLLNQGVPIDRAILFGSWAKGTARSDSDIDVGIVSSKFGADEIDELQYLLYQTRPIDNRIEPVPLSLHGFENDATPLILEMKKYGTVIDL